MGGGKQRLGWALTGSGHFFSECLEIMTRLEDLDIFVSKAAAENVRIRSNPVSRRIGYG